MCMARAWFVALALVTVPRLVAGSKESEVMLEVMQDVRLRQSPNSFVRLRRLKQLGFRPNGVFDIGANQGAWTRAILQVWPRAKVFMVEANPKQEVNLRNVGQPYAITLLGDSTRNTTLWLSPNEVTKKDGSTGNSIFRETSGLGKFEPVVRTMTTLDALALERGMTGFDMLKIDVQGAEKLILAGASTVLRSVQVVMLELGVVQYNAGAPMWLEVHLELDRLGFLAYDVLELHYDHRSQALIQIDVLFVRKDSPLTKKRATGYPPPKLPTFACSQS